MGSNAFGTVRGTSGACPCGSGRGYAACCARLHEGAVAATAEELMRSRYAAFAVGESDYLLRTWHPRTRPEDLDLDPRQRWTSLRVVSTDQGGPGDETGSVVYVARYLGVDGKPHEFREHARFARRGRRWVYVDGEMS